MASGREISALALQQEAEFLWTDSRETTLLRYLRALTDVAILGALCGLLARPCEALGDAAGEDGAARLERALGRLEASVPHLPRERLDPQAVIERVGRDAGKLLGWVRGSTSFVPYAGALRGPRGVLMDRVGGDVDRALLLAELISSSGYAVRLARVGLTEAEARGRLDAAARSALPPISDLPPATEMAALLDRAAEEARRLTAIVPAPASAPGWGKDQVEAAQDHWWVQYNDGKSWVDLDPASGDGTAAPTHLGTATPSTFACGLPDLAARVPAELFHSVEIRVVVERWQDGRLLEDVALSWALRTWDDPGIHVYLMHAFPHTPDVVAAGTDGEKLKAALLLETTWRPILMVNGRYRGPKTFDETGALSLAPTGGAAAVGGGVRRGFGGLGLATGEGAAKPTSVLTAEWLDIILRAPGSPPETLRREVFDSIGPAARAAGTKGPLQRPALDDAARLRRALALAGSADNLVASCRYPMEYVLYRRARRLLDARSDLLGALLDRRSASGREAIARSIDPDWLEMMGCGRGVERDRNVTYVDRPNVCRLVTQPGIGAGGKVLSISISDLAANSVAALAPSAEDRFAAALDRGVADTLCEEIAVGGLSRRPDDRSIHTTADAFDRAGKGGWVALRDPADAALAALPLPPDVLERVVGDLAAGHLVVITKESTEGRFAWWRVDPRSGRTVGVMDDGRCSDDAEYASTHIPEAEVEGTLPPRGPRVPMKGDWGRLAEQIIKFRNPSSWEEVFECWQEAYECLYGEWINPP